MITTWRRPAPSSALFGLGLLLASGAARAVIVLRYPGRNLQPPTGRFADSGWQFEGDWHGFTGTAIGPHHFLTAAHVRGYPGEAFVFRGRSYRALDATVIPHTDLCVWRVVGDMPAWAALYDGNQEVGSDVVLFGRGTRRGRPIFVGHAIRGWQVGANDDQLSWGRGWIMAVIPREVAEKAPVPYGEGLAIPFDADAGTDAGCVSPGDSGGGAFIKDKDNQWKLAGVIYGVEDGYATAPRDSATVQGVLTDTRGFWHRTLRGGWDQVPDNNGDPIPMISIASRVSVSAAPIRAAVRASSHTTRLLKLIGSLVVIPVVAVAVLIGFALRRTRRQTPTPAEEAANAIDTDP